MNNEKIIGTWEEILWKRIRDLERQLSDATLTMAAVIHSQGGHLEISDRAFVAVARGFNRHRRESDGVTVFESIRRPQGDKYMTEEERRAWYEDEDYGSPDD